MTRRRAAALRATFAGLFGLAVYASDGACVGPRAASAAGLYATDRGVRPLGRGGAFVAGADDLGAIAYNPAGIFDAGSSILVDGSFVLFAGDYTRRARLRQVDPNTGELVGGYEQTFPTVSGSATPVPIPTIVGSFAPHKDWRVAIGAFAPYAALPSYPAALDDGSPAPQRYSSISLDGSALLVLGGYAAWRPHPAFTLGAGLEVVAGSIQGRIALSGCLPDRWFCAPEDPDWDVLTEVAASPIVTPTGTIGLTAELIENVRFGAAFHLPIWIDAPTTIRTRLPSTPIFKNAEQRGEEANIAFELPWTLRAGFEVRELVPGLRVEVGAEYSHWEMHDQLRVTSKGLGLANLPAFPAEYLLPDIAIDRGFQSTISGRIGGEYAIELGAKRTLTARAGFSYETSAIPAPYLSVLTLDAPKATPSVGASFAWDRYRLDAVYAHSFLPTIDVGVDDAKLRPTSPLQANPPEFASTVNAGVYSWQVNVVGVGVAVAFDDPAEAPVLEDPTALDEAPNVDAPAAPSDASDDSGDDAR